MDTKIAPAYIYSTHEEAEVAIRKLNQSGFDLKKLSLLGEGYHSEEQPLGFYTTADKIRTWGVNGAIWGGIWGLVMGPAVFFLPGIGLLVLADPTATVLIAALEGAVLVGGLSALGAALSQIGVSDNQIVKFEMALKVNKYFLMVHGDADDLAQVHSVLANAVVIL